MAPRMWTPRWHDPRLRTRVPDASSLPPQDPWPWVSHWSQTLELQPLFWAWDRSLSPVPEPCPWMLSSGLVGPTVCSGTPTGRWVMMEHEGTASYSTRIWPPCVRTWALNHKRNPDLREAVLRAQGQVCSSPVLPGCPLSDPDPGQICNRERNCSKGHC
jgi:hypothetical protein